MQAYTANLINAIVLVAMGAWGYLGSDTPSVTALIPVVFGLILIALSGGVKKENKVIAHIAVVLTLLALLGNIGKPLMRALSENDTMATIRVGLMVLASAYAMFAFIQSFRAARKARG